MARPRKSGMDYFPHDVNLSTDRKIEVLRALYGNDGYAFYCIMLENIYREQNYELVVSDAETIQILARKVSVSVDMLERMIATAIKYECFDAAMYNKYRILTSNGIKKRAETVENKRSSMRNSYSERVSEAEINLISGAEKVVSEAETDIGNLVSEAETLVPAISGVVSDAETMAEMTLSKVKHSKELKHIAHPADARGAWIESFDKVWKEYPEKAGRQRAVKAWKQYYSERHGEVDVEQIISRIKSYVAMCKAQKPTPRPLKDGSTFFINRSWEDEKWAEPEPKTAAAPKERATVDEAPRQFGVFGRN